MKVVSRVDFRTLNKTIFTSWYTILIQMFTTFVDDNDYADDITQLPFEYLPISRIKHPSKLPIPPLQPQPQTYNPGRIDVKERQKLTLNL